MKSQATLLLAAVALAASTWPAFADIIELKDGRSISGSISRQADTAIIKSDDGTTLSAPFADVVRVTLKDDAPPAAAGDAAQFLWSHLAPQIVQSSNLQSIIKLHQKFLAEYPDAPLARDVAESLKQYQIMADSGAIKFHGKWMTPDQVEIDRNLSRQAAGPALDAYAAGRIKKSLDLVMPVLAKDSQNAPALTVAGLVACRSGNLAVARKYFESLAQSDPTSVLAQNNLAVICLQQNQVGEGMLHYISGLLIAPDSRPLLDNIAEVIHSYQSASGDKKSTLFRALSDAYAAAEANMESNQAKHNLYRYGSTWLTKEDRDAAVNKVKSIHDQMALLDAQYRTANDTLARLNQQIQQTSANYDNAVNGVRNTAGQTVSVYSADSIVQMRSPVPTAGYVTGPSQYRQLDQISNTKGSLEAQRDVLQAHMPDFFRQAEALKQQLADAAEPFTGAQNLIDLEISDSSSEPPRSAVQTGIAALPAVPSPSNAAAEIALAGEDPENPVPPDHGGVYNPPSVSTAGPRVVPKNLPRWGHPTPIPPGPYIWTSKPVPLGQGSTLPDGNHLYTSNGVYDLGDGSHSFSYNNGQWSVTQNGTPIYQTPYPTIHGLPPAAGAGSGTWVINQQGLAVRQ